MDIFAKPLETNDFEQFRQSLKKGTADDSKEPEVKDKQGASSIFSEIINLGNKNKEKPLFYINYVRN